MSLTPEEMEMIQKLTATGKFKITPLTEGEEDIDRGLKYERVSTPRTERKFEHGLEETMSRPHSGSVPKISTFSGDQQPQKNEVTYRAWRYEVQYLADDPEISESTLGQAIRRSLRGGARLALMGVDNQHSFREILSKFDILYGDVRTKDMIMQEFFNSYQKPGENVTEFGCRLDGMLQVAVEHGHLDMNSKNDLLRRKFWYSLSCDKLKSQTRHKFAL
ncbi:paraneoplastic antigen Ma1 homolog [Argopecten irradians]|uniref:paraneoplastic antigen Ma1 homolog n=1 Tax=Argopecten irradians TaxID=31199 RepID=UPI00371DB741